MDFDEVAKTLTIGVVSPQFRLWNGSDIKVDREDVFIGASSADGLLRWHSMRAGIPILVGSILGQAVEPGQRLVFCSGPRLPVEIELNARLDEGVVETTLLTNQTLPPCAPLS